MHSKNIGCLTLSSSNMFWKMDHTLMLLWQNIWTRHVSILQTGFGWSAWSFPPSLHFIFFKQKVRDFPLQQHYLERMVPYTHHLVLQDDVVPSTQGQVGPFSWAPFCHQSDSGTAVPANQFGKQTKWSANCSVDQFPLHLFPSSSESGGNVHESGHTREFRSTFIIHRNEKDSKRKNKHEYIEDERWIKGIMKKSVRNTVIPWERISKSSIALWMHRCH